ncbi:hypothetical protein BO71DRAFT_433378 [Aspergillus ellipticus CBS 707.79]|uniref:Uncharacterized protein n=1 Tax=Aspergillus ellipticus CBS 707.79 TaxID=1448320 RepID=A0A319D8P9_9EURO|nr:hypothetical protein BO71DRAFT_433378 [Aspergillus ellipticus CBS 707.79]
MCCMCGRPATRGHIDALPRYSHPLRRLGWGEGLSIPPRDTPPNHGTRAVRSCHRRGGLAGHGTAGGRRLDDHHEAVWCPGVRSRLLGFDPSTRGNCIRKPISSGHRPCRSVAVIRTRLACSLPLSAMTIDCNNAMQAPSTSLSGLWLSRIQRCNRGARIVQESPSVAHHRAPMPSTAKLAHPTVGPNLLDMIICPLDTAKRDRSSRPSIAAPLDQRRGWLTGPCGKHILMSSRLSTPSRHAKPIPSKPVVILELHAATRRAVTGGL